MDIDATRVGPRNSSKYGKKLMSSVTCPPGKI